jgi:transposase
VFESTYLFGAFSPIDGSSFLLELPMCNTDMFQIFLDNFSQNNPTEFKILVLDNGAFHKAKKLTIPGNIALLFQPPYSPELNPAEKIWAYYKRKFSNILCKNLDEITDFIIRTTIDIRPVMIKSICNYSYVSSGINWTI